MRWPVTSRPITPDHTNEQVQLAIELVEISTEAGDLERALEAYEHRSEALLELGEIQAAKADVEAMSDIAAELHQPSQDWIVAQLRAHHALLEGSFDKAEGLMADALSLGERAESWNAAVSFRLQLYVLRPTRAGWLRLSTSSGDRSRTTRHIRSGAASWRTWPRSWGTSPSPRRRSRPWRSTASPQSPSRDVAREHEPAGRDSELLRHADEAEILRELLLPYADRVAVCTPEFTAGSVSYYLALLSSTIGRSKEAERHFEAAIATNERIGARPWLAHTQEAYARELIARGGSDDIAKAGHLLEQALTIYRELRMKPSGASASAED